MPKLFLVGLILVSLVVFMPVSASSLAEDMPPPPPDILSTTPHVSPIVSLSSDTPDPSNLPPPDPLIPPLVTVDTPTLSDIPPASASGDVYIGPRPITEIVIHHSGSPQSAAYTAVQTVEGYKRYHMQSVHPGIYSDESTWGSLPAQEGFPDGYSNGTGYNTNDIDYHFLISAAGEVIVGRPLSSIGWNASNWGSNVRNIGICFIGNFDSVQPTEAAIQAGIKLVSDLLVRYSIYTISQHSQYAAKSCPGYVFPFAKFKEDAFHKAGIFSDTHYTDWFHGSLVDHGMIVDHVITGYPDGSFRPSAPVTRAEFVSMIWRASASPKVVYKLNFWDTVGHWADPAIQWATQTKLISGYGANTFRPDKSITRAEAAQIMRLWRVLSDGLATATTYPDVPISAWYAMSIHCVTVHGLMFGYADGYFRPERPITRAEAITINTRIILP